MTSDRLQSPSHLSNWWKESLDYVGAILSLMFKTDHVLLDYKSAFDYYHAYVTEKENPKGPIIMKIKLI